MDMTGGNHIIKGSVGFSKTDKIKGFESTAILKVHRSDGTEETTYIISKVEKMKNVEVGLRTQCGERHLKNYIKMYTLYWFV